MTRWRRGYADSVTGSTWSDPRVGRLFAEPPERFTAARDALAADLVRAGKRSAAREVRALRRPTRRLWVLNQTAREHRDEVQALLDAGNELRRAHTAAVRGEPSPLREADLDLSRRLDALVQIAGRVAADAGHPADHALLVGVRNDLRTIATTDTDDAERLRSGTLDHLPRARGGAPRRATAERKDARHHANEEAREAVDVERARVTSLRQVHGSRAP